MKGDNGMSFVLLGVMAFGFTIPLTLISLCMMFLFLLPVLPLFFSIGFPIAGLALFVQALGREKRNIHSIKQSSAVRYGSGLGSAYKYPGQGLRI